MHQVMRISLLACAIQGLVAFTFQLSRYSLRKARDSRIGGTSRLNEIVHVRPHEVGVEIVHSIVLLHSISD